MEISVSWDELRQRSLFITIPMYGGKNDFGFCKGLSDLTALLTHYQIKYETFILANESLIPRARNYCVDVFLRSNMTHMIFIDSDIGFNAHQVIDMLALANPLSEYQILCGPYAKKTISYEKLKLAVDSGVADHNPNELEKFVGDFVFNLLPSNSPDGMVEIDLGAPFKISEGGTGFMMIQRYVFERIADLYPELLYLPDHARTKFFDGTREIMCYFDCEVDKGYFTFEYERIVKKLAESKKDIRMMKDLYEQAKTIIQVSKKSSKRYLSEDYWFCRLAQKAGISVWMLPWIKLNHCGTFIFSGDLSAMAKLGIPPSVDMKKIENMK